MSPTTTTNGFRLDDGQIEVVDHAMAEILRTKTTAEKIAMVNEAHRTAKALIAAGIRRMNPHWTDAEIQIEVSRRLIRGAK